MSSVLLSAPELLAPAGDWDCARAAVANGANAVYFGLDCGFNARARAVNFAPEKLSELLAFLHASHVRGYVTLNTLAFHDELPGLETLVRQIAAAGADAVLVQDLGLARMVREICPDLEIHASTQMTLTSAECIAAVRDLGLQRVVAPRELSIDEIAQITRECPVPLEVFVHGALCVAYSGQCLTSESLGGRSANRGQCAQACRLPYELVCDGQDVDLGAQKYLLSPQDLAAYALVPELMAAGVASLKIEGRLKTPEYVANITAHYRRAIDAAVEAKAAEFTARDQEEMELSFSRGFSVGWLHGCDHKMLVPALSSAKRGVLVGSVYNIWRDRIELELTRSVKPGDGLVFAGDRAAGQEQGGRLFELWSDGYRVSGEAGPGVVEVSFAHGSIRTDKLTVGQEVWKTDDPELTRRLRKTFAGRIEGAAESVDFVIRAAVGEQLLVTATRGEQTFGFESEGPLSEATRHPISLEVLQQQFGRLGGTGFSLGELQAEILGQPMVPLSVLGKIRHELVAALQAAEPAKTVRALAPKPVLPQLRSELPKPADADAAPQLHVLCRSLSQLQAVLDSGQRRVIAEFQDVREYGDAVRQSHAAGAKILLATPRIQKPGEFGLFRVLLRHGADGILARNLSGLAFYAEQGVPVVADFALNAANELTTLWLRKHGAERIAPSYDLNRDQLLDLVSSVPAEWLEVVIHQHMPMFHMEHCVFCAVMSPGTNKTNCGRPCDVHQVKLRDRVGSEHPLVADVGCRNTLYNAAPQSAAEAVPELLERGVRHFRVEFLADMPADEVAPTIDLYHALLRGRRSGREVWTALKAVNRVGVTRGTLEARRDPLAIL